MFALVAVSCVYPFDVETDQVPQKAFVFDGDIVLGGWCTISVSCMTPFGKSSDSEEEKEPVVPSRAGKMTVYCNNGEVYPGFQLTGGVEKISYQFDFAEAPLDKQYRLVYEEEGSVYSTSWMDVSIAPTPDEITVEYDADNVYLGLKLKGDDSASRYYRWNYEETYEYHADFMPDYYLDFSVDLNRKLAYIERTAPVDPNYYCWGKSASRESTLISTENLSENTIAKQVFRTISRTSKRIMEMYRIDVRMKGISRDGYYFHKTLLANSNTSGSLFAPTPSEMRGNVVSEQNPSELVLGYVDVITESVTTKFIDGRYSRWRSPDYQLFLPEFNFRPDDPEAEGFTPMQWYDMGYRPVLIPKESEGDSVYWVEKRCVDCTLEGGNKNKPSDWPTTHE